MLSQDDKWPDLGSQLPDAVARLRARALRTAKEAKPTPTAGAGGGVIVPTEVVQERVRKTLADLDALTALDEGERLPWPGMPNGVGWDIGGLYLAGRLVEAANSGADYTLETAQKDFLEHSPGLTGTYDPEHKWAEAVKYVGARPMPYESPADVFGSIKVDVRVPEDGEIHGGQVRMAYRLAARWTGKLLYVYGVGWHYWDGRRWAPDNIGRAERAVVSILKHAILQSLNDKKLRADIGKCDSAAGIRGVLAVAAVLEQFAYTPEQMDADPFLLNCANGTLDLRDRKLRPHNPEDRNTKVARGAYNADADLSVWSAFLNRVLPDDDERGYLRRVIGQSVYGGVREHLFPVLTGVGANGKGTAYGAICNALGDYATVINPDLLMMHDRGGIGGPEMMVLRGARLVVASELGKDRVLDDSLMKRLTGGDQLTARHLFKEPVTWHPTHQLLYVSNHKPRTQGDDAAVWRRMRIIPFDVVIPEEERDLTLGETLALYADAVLTWAVGGFWDHEDNGGMREPESVLAATSNYQHENDDVARFIEDRCEVGRGYRVTTVDLWNAWLNWRDDEGSEVLSKKSFGTALENRGFRADNVFGVGRVRRGIQLRSESDEELI